MWLGSYWGERRFDISFLAQVLLIGLRFSSSLCGGNVSRVVGSTFPIRDGVSKQFGRQHAYVPAGSSGASF